MALERDIARHSGLGAERGRLREPGGRLEFVRTQELLSRFLPAPPAVVVDVGGGAGVHAVPLAAAGYEVELLDPVELHVEQARADAREQGVRLPARVGDARRLPYADASVDAALLLGPLYHLTDRAARLTALAEARRVLRSSGVLAAPRDLALCLDVRRARPRIPGRPAVRAHRRTRVRDGQHRNPDVERHPEWFTTAYFHHPDEVRGELEDAGVRVEAVVAIEGPGSFRPQLDKWLDDVERRDVLLRAIRRVETEPTVLGASTHLLAFGRA